MGEEVLEGWLVGDGESVDDIDGTSVKLAVELVPQPLKKVVNNAMTVNAKYLLMILAQF